MVWNFVVQLLVAVALSVISYLITPKPKGPKPAAVQQGEAPVSKAGMPIAKFWGTMTLKEGNVLWYGDKSQLVWELVEKV